MEELQKLLVFKHLPEIVSCMCLFFAVMGFIFGWMSVPRQISFQRNQITILEDEVSSIKNLQVKDKKIEPYGIMGVLNEYYLILSNGRIIYVSKADFYRYEINQYYDFELSEKTTVRQEIRKMKE